MQRPHGIGEQAINTVIEQHPAIGDEIETKIEQEITAYLDTHLNGIGEAA